MNATEPVLILGSGALATLFAARLTRSGTPVSMLAGWPEGRRALALTGATLVEADGSEHSWPVGISDDPRDCRAARFALVLVKSWQTERAAQQLAACLSEDGLALSLQNGLGNREVLAAALGADRSAQGVTTTGATLLGPGRVRPGGEGALTIEAHARIGPLAGMLRQAGFSVDAITDVRAAVWGKLVINAAINPLTALLRVPNGELLERPSARALMAALAREAAAVAVAQDVRLPFNDPVAAAETVARNTASNRSSMLQDVLRGAPTEIDAICGAIVRLGDAGGLPVEANRACWQLVRAAAGSPRPGVW